MTRDGLKAYLTQISQSDDPVASRWEPTILCSMIDTVSDEDINELIDLASDRLEFYAVEQIQKILVHQKTKEYKCRS